MADQRTRNDSSGTEGGKDVEPLRGGMDEIDRRLEQIRDGDPFVKEGVAQYELLPWLPGIGKDDLDRL